MPEPLPPTLATALNASVLRHLEAKSAHPDLVDVFRIALKPLGDVQLYCPDWQAYRYVAASTKGVIFALAVGMHTIALRLDPRMRSRALQTGGEPYPECGEAWVAVLHRQPDDDWPAVDVPFWARKAYFYARER